MFPYFLSIAQKPSKHKTKVKTHMKGHPRQGCGVFLSIQPFNNDYINIHLDAEVVLLIYLFFFFQFWKPLFLRPLTETDQPERAGVALAHAHAFFLVDVQGVSFHSQVILQRGFGVDQGLQGVLRIPQALLQSLDGVVHLVDLVNKAAGGRAWLGRWAHFCSQSSATLKACALVKFYWRCRWYRVTMSEALFIARRSASMNVSRTMPGPPPLPVPCSP